MMGQELSNDIQVVRFEAKVRGHTDEGLSYTSLKESQEVQILAAYVQRGWRRHEHTVKPCRLCRCELGQHLVLKLTSSASTGE